MIISKDKNYHKINNRIAVTIMTYIIIIYEDEVLVEESNKTITFSKLKFNHLNYFNEAKYKQVFHKILH